MLLLFFPSGEAPPQTWTYVASDGAAVGGSALLAKAKAFVPTGGLGLAGVAGLAKAKDYLSSGGSEVGGAAVLAKVKDYLALGGAVADGMGESSYTPAEEEVPPTITMIQMRKGGRLTGVLR